MAIKVARKDPAEEPPEPVVPDRSDPEGAVRAVSSGGPEDLEKASPQSASTPGSRSQLGGLFEAVEQGQEFETRYGEGVLDEKAVLEIKDLGLYYGDFKALHGIRLICPEGKVTSLIGPSGCGKSTLLRTVNRMNDLIDSVRIEGEMLLNGTSVYGPGVDVIELRKRIGMVFQKPNPFPMSIFENVVYSLRIDGEKDKNVLEQVCEESLRGAGLWEEAKDRLKKSALQLSGGQQQRLCIARAIAAAPEVLLLDEPCSALDPIATGRIEELIDELKGSYSILIVTHNMQQASRTSDFTAFMYLGRLVEFGTTEQIFLQPILKETEDYVTGQFG